MAPSGDPYRILGLQPGASAQEVKAAYRRLVKAFHPDTAGEKATARFLAIQAAYDAITGGTDGGRRASARREPWRADPERARWARDREGERARADGERQRPPGEKRRRPGDADQAATGDRNGPRRGRRDRRKATPGSTSYDDATTETFNPEWSGASWYGTTSGTYWTVNPREYADPRKHGPEYQARARRAWQRGDPMTWAADGPGSGSSGTAQAADDDRPRASPGTDAAGAAHATGATETTDAGRRPPPPRPTFRPAAAEPADGAPSPRPGGFDPTAALPLGPALPTRAVLALVGWPPLGYALAAIVSNANGCARFAASCVDTFDVWTWLGQLAILALLLAVPRLASISAVGTLAALAASVPGAVVLSAAGGAQQRDSAASVLMVVLVVAYVVGVTFAVARDLRTVRR